MKCTKCGAELRDELNFCIKCGEVNSNSHRPQNGVQKKKKTSIWMVLLVIFFLPIALTYLIGKNEKLKTSVKLAGIALVWGMTIFIGSQSESENPSETNKQATQEVAVTNSDEIVTEENTKEDNTKQEGTKKENVEKSAEDTPIKVKAISVGKKKSYEQIIGNKKEITVKMTPAGIKEDSFVIKNSNDKVVSAKIAKIENKGNSTILVLQTEALAGGKTKLCIQSKDKKVSSNKLTFKVSKVESISDFGFYADREMEVGDSISYTCPLKPKKLSGKDIKIVTKKSGVVRVSNVKFKSKKAKTILKFKVTAVGAGKTKLFIKSKIGKMSSDKVTFTVKKKDTSPTVYTTPYGERYHYSSSCAGSNASATTLNKARPYYGPCGKCAG